MWLVSTVDLYAVVLFHLRNMCAIALKQPDQLGLKLIGTVMSVLKTILIKITRLNAPITCLVASVSNGGSRCTFLKCLQAIKANYMENSLSMR